MWRTHKEAGRPWPTIVPDDDFLDYMVMEAVAIRVAQENERERKEQERKAEVDKERKRLQKVVG